MKFVRKEIAPLGPIRRWLEKYEGAWFVCSTPVKDGEEFRRCGAETNVLLIVGENRQSYPKCEVCARAEEARR